jgi:RHS repeat-associated protein
MNLVLDYNPNTLNLESRENKIMGLKEGFSYDNLDRLTDVRIVNSKHTSTVYEDNGNIKTKTDVGTYAYDANKINAVKNITAPVNQSDISTLNQDITYTSFNKVKTIKENDYEITYHYGADFQRKKAELKYQNQLQYTKYYHGNFEKIVEASGKTTEVTQVNSLNGNVAVHVKTTQNNQINNNVFFVYTDQLGSPLVLTNNTGDIVYEQSFDAWGRKRNPNNWNDYENIPETPTWLRGYTGHEHLPEFDLINMNGRMYDPITATMLSADPLVSDPENIQNYNRYSYVLNNPLKYVDPSGYFQMPGGFRSSHGPGAGGFGPGGGSLGARISTQEWDTRKGEHVFFSQHEYGTFTQINSGDFFSTNVIGIRELYHSKNPGNPSTPGYYGNSSGAGGNGRGGNEMLEVASNIFGTAGIGAGVKKELLEFTVRNNYKSGKTRSQFKKLSSKEKNWRYKNTLGKTGSKYLKLTKGLGVIGTTVGVIDASVKVYDNPSAGNTTRLVMQGIIIGSSAIPVAGWAISLSLATVDVIFGDQIYNSIDR